MQPKKYQEWLTDGKGDKLKLLRTVSIYESEAENQNQDELRTKVLYVPVDEEKPVEGKLSKEARKELFAEIEQLGGTLAKNATDEQLKAKVEELKKANA